MPSAEIITIGTELLLGEIQDTNTRYLARLLRDHGIDIYRTTIVGDNKTRVAQVIRESMSRADIIITTGGLGPTVDDPTREAVALALDVDLVHLPELWEQIVNRFQRYGRIPTENNKRQAYVPQGAIPVENPVGTAPAFIVDTGKNVIISLPGVPREMEYLSIHAVIPYLRNRFSLHEIIKARVLHTIGVGESQIDDIIGDLETLANPTVGLLAHPGQVDIRITVKANSVEEADQKIEEVERLIRARLGNDIYGVDDQQIEDVISNFLDQIQWQINILTFGFEEKSISRLMKITEPRRITQYLEIYDQNQFTEELSRIQESNPANASLGLSLIPAQQKLILSLLWYGNGKLDLQTRTYGGPPALGSDWAVNQALEFIRRKALDYSNPR